MFPIDLTFFGDFSCDFSEPSGFRDIVGVCDENIMGLGGGLTIRPLPDGSTNLKAKRGRGNMMASHQVSAAHHRCFPFGICRRFGVEMLAFRSEFRGEGFK